MSNTEAESTVGKKTRKRKSSHNEPHTPSPKKPWKQDATDVTSRPIAHSPKKGRRQSAVEELAELGASSPATPHTMKEWDLTPEKANLLTKHGRKVKTFMPLTSAASKEVLALRWESTSHEFSEILGRNAERMAAENNDRQNYSGLTSQQLQSIYSANNLRRAGTIEYDTSAELLNNVQIDESFFTQLKVLLRSTARATEAGCRLHIGLYLMNAADAARVFYRKNIALFAEVPVEHPELPGIGQIGGNLDFLASTVAGDEDMRDDAEYALPEKPNFIVVEAKKSSTLGQHSSKAELLAELLTLDYLDREPEGRMGLLTDGNSWDFHYIKQASDGFKLYRAPRITTSTAENVKLVLGLLVHCCAGKTPTEDATSLLRVVRS